MSFEPVPARSGTRPPTASLTARNTERFSSSVMVEYSPVVPHTTRPSQPSSTSCTARAAVASRSTERSSWKTVTMAVSRVPNRGAGRSVGAGKLSCVMPTGYRPDRASAVSGSAPRCRAIAVRMAPRARRLSPLAE